MPLTKRSPSEDADDPDYQVKKQAKPTPRRVTVVQPADLSTRGHDTIRKITHHCDPPKEQGQPSTVKPKRNRGKKKKAKAGNIPNQVTRRNKPRLTFRDADHSRIVTAIALVLNTRANELLDNYDLVLPVGIEVGEFCDNLAMAVELSVYRNFQTKAETNSAGYGSKMRAIRYNLEKNPVLSHEVLCDGISPERLATMTTDQMAIKLLKEMQEQIRAQQEINITLVKSTGPRIRKTHKGEEVVGGDRERTVSPQPDDSFFFQSNVSSTSTSGKGHPQGITDHVNNATQATNQNFDIQGVWGHIASRTPDMDDDGDTEMGNSYDEMGAGDYVDSMIDGSFFDTTRHGSEPIVISDDDDDDSDSQIHVTPTHSALIDLNHDGDLLHTPLGTPMITNPRPTRTEILWVGRIEMDGVVSLCLTARLIGGPAEIAGVTWPNLLSEVLNIDGNSPASTTGNFLRNLRKDRSTEVLTFAMSPMDGVDKDEYDQLYQRIHDPSRYPVVNRHFLKCIRKAYVIFLKEHEPLPFWFLSLYPITEVERDFRTGRLLLVALVIYTDLVGMGGSSKGVQPEAGSSSNQYHPDSGTDTRPSAKDQDVMEFFSLRR